MAKKFLTGITIAATSGGEYTFPIADGSANQAIVTDGNGNLSFGSAIASSAEDAQRLVCEMINNSGSTIGAFLPVCCVGIHSDGTPEIAPARADNPLYMPAIGITQSAVGNNNRTDILLYGKLEGINTTAYQTGDTLYVAPTGGWSTTRPTGSNLIQAVFKVGRIQQNNGSGGAFGAGKYEDLPNIASGSVWIGDASSHPVATALSTAIPAALGYTPVPDSRTITINGTSYDLSENRAWTITTDASARSILRYVATAGQTTFTISGGYTPGLTDVYRNGVKLDNSTDFTATNGTTIVLTNGASVNDVIEVYRYQTAFLANNSLRTVTEFIATAGQTTFSVTYNSGLVDVFYNGSKLLSTEYTAGNGTSIVLNFPCNLNDTLEVHAYSYAVGAFTGQAQLNGTGFVKANGTTITYDNSTYLTTASASSTYLPLSGGTLTGSLSGTNAKFFGSQLYYTELGADQYGGFLQSYNSSTSKYQPYLIYGGSDTTTFSLLTLNNSGAIFSKNVGIGTAPDNTYQGLTIFGSNPSLRLKAESSGSWTWTEYVNSSGVNNFSMGVSHSTPVFVIKAGAGLDNPHFAMASNGNIGIGNITPSNYAGGGLTIGSSSTGKNLILYSSIDGSNGVVQFIDRNGSNAFQLGGNATDMYLYGYGNRPLYIATNGVERMRIAPDGAMAFNDSIPAVRSYLFKALPNRQLAIEALEAGGVHSIYLRPSASGRNLITSNYFSGGAYLPLALSGREVDSDLVIHTNGNVSIGSASDIGTKLQVNGANYVEMATFACTTSAASDIMANNGGTVQFSAGNARHCSNTSLFVPVTNGIQITKAGIVHVSFSQDITTAGTTGYVAGYITKNGTIISENLITNTGGQWDGINGVTTINVNASDVIGFVFNANDILSFDPNTWSNYSFIWTSR